MTRDGWTPGGREAFRAGLKAEHELGERAARLSECEACGKLKADCASTTTGGRFPMDVYACAECRGCDPEED